MADELDFSELNSTMAELRLMLEALGPALMSFQAATLGGAAGADRLGQASQAAAKTTEEYGRSVGGAGKALKNETAARRKTNENLEEERKQRQKAREKAAEELEIKRANNEILYKANKEVRLHTDVVKQDQRARRDLVAVFRGMSSSALAEIALGAQRFAQAKNLMNTEQVKIDQALAEIPIKQQELKKAQEALAQHQQYMVGLQETIAIQQKRMQSLREEIARRKAEETTAREKMVAEQENLAILRTQVERGRAQLRQQEDEAKAKQEAAEAARVAAEASASEVETLGQRAADAEKYSIDPAAVTAARAAHAAAVEAHTQNAAAYQRLSEEARVSAAGLVTARGSMTELEGQYERAGSATAQAEEAHRKAAAKVTGLESSVGVLQDAIEGNQDALVEADERTGQLNAAVKNATDGIENLGASAIDAAANLRNMKMERVASAVSTITNSGQRLGQWMEKTGFALRDFQRRVGISAIDLGKMLFTDTGKAIGIMKGKWKEMVGARGQDYFDRMIEARDVFGDEFGGTLTGAAAGKLAAQARSMGVTVQELAKARRGFMTLSEGNLKQATDAQNKFVMEFKKKGLNTKDAFQAVMQYTDIMARNGTRFAASFAKAAADAKKIGVDLKKVDAFGDSIISDYEGFLEKQAELGAMGFNFDSNKLGQIAESGDTGALMNELRSQLAAQGKDLTKMRRSEQLALSNAFGIPMEELLRLSQPKPQEGTREDRMLAHGEATARGVERIDKATLNLPPQMSAIGMLLQKIFGFLGMTGPIFTLLAGFFAKRGAAKVAAQVAEVTGGDKKGMFASLLEKFRKAPTKEGAAEGAAKPSLMSRLTSRFRKTPEAEAAASTSTFYGGKGGPSATAQLAAQMRKANPALSPQAALAAARSQAAAAGTPEPGEAKPSLMSRLMAPFRKKEGAGVAEATKSAEGIKPSTGSRIAEFGKGIGALGKGAGAAIQAILKGIAQGIAAFGKGPMPGYILIGAGVIAASIAIIGAGIAGAAWIMGKALPTLAEGFKSFNDIDGMNLVKVGLGLTALGIGLTAFGVGTAAAGIGGFVGGFFEWLTPGESNPMTKLEEFTRYDIDADKVANNAKALVAYSVAMAAYGGGQLGNAVGAIAGAVADFYQTNPPIDRLQEFSRFNINAAKVEENANAMVAYGKAMAAYGGGQIGNAVGAIAGAIADFYQVKPPVDRLQDFAKLDIEADKVKTNAEAFAAFAQAMSAYAGSGEGFGGVIAKAAAKFFEVPLDDALVKFEEFAKKDFGKNISKVKANAEAFGAFSAAMSSYKSTGEGLTSVAAKKFADWFSVDMSDPLEKFEEFAKKDFGDAGKVKSNAEAFQAFSTAMSSFTGEGKLMTINEADFTAVLAVFKKFAVETLTLNVTKVKEAAEAFGKFKQAISALESSTQIKSLNKTFEQLAKPLDAIQIALSRVAISLGQVDVTKLNTIRTLFTPQFTAAFTASIMALANIYEGRAVNANAIRSSLPSTGTATARTGGDVVSNSGYGERTLVTPSGPVALHNSDTVVAYANDMVANDGIRLLSKGALLNNQPSNPNVNVTVDMSRLERKLDAVVQAIGGMNVQMDGARVGKVLVNSAETGGQIGLFNAQSRATL